MPAKARICIVCPGVYPLFREGVAASAGGAEAQLMTLGKALSQQAHEVHFIVDEFGQSDLEEIDGIMLHKVPLRYMGGSNIHLPVDWFRFTRKLASINADMHLMKVPRNILFPLAVYARIRGKKVAYVGQRDVDATQEGARSVDGVPAYYFYRWGLFLVNAVIAQTTSQQKCFSESFNRDAIVIPNVVTLPAEQVTEKSDYVLWVGNSSYRKQPEVFLEIVRALPGIKFRMIMAGSNERPDDAFVSDPAANLPNLEYLGFVPFQKIKDEYSNACLFVSTSKSEGFPNTFLQSWQCGTPVVSLYVDPDGVIDRHGLGVVTGSEQRMVETLRKLMDDANMRQKLAMNSIRYVQNHHSLEAIVAQYRSLFHQLGLAT